MRRCGWPRRAAHDAVQMRVIAKHAVRPWAHCIVSLRSVEEHLLAAALTRQFRRVGGGWDGRPAPLRPRSALDQLSDYLHDRWQTDPLLTEAMVKARVTDRTAATDVVNQAAAIIEDLLARTAGGTPTIVDRRVAAVIADIWLANLTAFIGQSGPRKDPRTHHRSHPADTGQPGIVINGLTPATQAAA